LWGQLLHSDTIEAKFSDATNPIDQPHIVDQQTFLADGTSNGTAGKLLQANALFQD
jgi:hypothetical protein